VRALLVEKDNAPQWCPGTLAGVDGAAIAQFFEAPWPADQHPLADLA
jgi:hypothetical protein